MNMENEKAEQAKVGTDPDYLDRLADGLSKSGHPHAAIDIQSAASEIRRLDRELTFAKTAQDTTDQMLGNLSEAILAVINEELEAKIVEMLEDKVREALDDYDPTQHYDFDDAVDRRVSESSVDDIVRDMLDNASVSISV
jgi:uncharacterized membrane protein YheB (UPF0754 family)